MRCEAREFVCALSCTKPESNKFDCYISFEYFIQLKMYLHVSYYMRVVDLYSICGAVAETCSFVSSFSREHSPAGIYIFLRTDMLCWFLYFFLHTLC